MPGPLTHLAYAQQYLADRPDLDRDALMRGSAFPDVRHYAGIAREVTHPVGVTLADAAAEADAWRVGFLLHNYLDEAWSEYMGQFGLVPGRAKDEITWLALKIVEEIQLYDWLEDREGLVAVFSGVALPVELGFGASEEAVRKWDAFMRTELERRFESESWRRLALDLGYAEDVLDELLAKILELRDDELWLGRIQQLEVALGYGPKEA